MGVKNSIWDLERDFPEIVKRNVPLKQISRWKIGGIAKVVISPRSIEELAKIRSWIHKRNLPSLVFGATSNLLFDDEGLDAIAIHIGSSFSSFNIHDVYITAEPGVWVPGLARSAMLAGLTGIEHTCGIPGTLGGLVCMNGGSQRKGIGSHIYMVKTVDQKGNIKQYTQQESNFAYRQSIFQNKDEVIAEIVLKLDRSYDLKKHRVEMLKILQDRRSKFPLKLPNCGSVFVSNPAMYENYGPPGKVIENLGLKGYRVGEAMIHNLHANFIVNLGEAKSKDVLRLINYIRDEVFNKTGYNMRVEAKFVERTGLIQDI